MTYDNNIYAEKKHIKLNIVSSKRATPCVLSSFNTRALSAPYGLLISHESCQSAWRRRLLVAFAGLGLLTRFAESAPGAAILGCRAIIATK